MIRVVVMLIAPVILKIVITTIAIKVKKKHLIWLWKALIISINKCRATNKILPKPTNNYKDS